MTVLNQPLTLHCLATPLFRFQDLKRDQERRRKVTIDGRRRKERHKPVGESTKNGTDTYQADGHELLSP